MSDSQIRKVYLDSAATSFPKPPEVLEALTSYLETAGNPGRGSHSYAMSGARLIMEARQEIARFLGIQEDERLIFTPGCTASINFVVKGYLNSRDLSHDSPGVKDGGIIVTSGLEHNSVMRPLSQLGPDSAFEFRSLGAGKEGVDVLEQLESLLQSSSSVALCAITAASNVTGEVLPFKEAATLCRKYGVACLVDGAQVAGKLPLDLSSTDISFFCASGHKGLMGPPGVGLLYIAPGFDLNPLIAGGTGSGSESFNIPTAYPDRLEAGTAPGHDIWALSRGVDWIVRQNPEKLLAKELGLVQGFLNWASKQPGVRIYGPSGDAENRDRTGNAVRMPVVSFELKGCSPNEVACKLDAEYGIALRSGLHCAAQAHESLGTLDTGLCRLSFGPGNSEADLESLTEALEEILSGMPCS